MKPLSSNVINRIRAGLARLEARQEIAAAIAAAPSIKVGDRRTFYSTAVGRPHDKPRLCHYSGQDVDVIGISWAAGMPDFNAEDSETVFTVRTDDGVQFDAFAGELNGWYFRTAQYVLPDGTYAPTS